jgi:class 3 adenylate cyclase
VQDETSPSELRAIASEQITEASEIAVIPATPEATETAPHPEISEVMESDATRVESPLSQYVPQELMKKLEAARSSGDMVGERRVVTMLFCDIKGSTSAAELLDPEEWTEIINGAFEHMIKPVYTYEGTVARLMGDSILAFFGAPLAHEDDPQRAVLAGLDILAKITPYREKIMQEWGIDFNVRVSRV